MTPALPELDPAARAEHIRWAIDLTTIPTAAGREGRVCRWIERWAAARPDLRLARDRHGNIEIALDLAARSERPVWLTAHLDHPAFVVERVERDGALELSFRGGVMDDYFDQAEIEVFLGDDRRLSGRIHAKTGDHHQQFPLWRAVLDRPDEGGDVCPGDIARWALPPAEIARVDGVECLLTHACDDLAAAAAALAAFDVMRRDPGPPPDVRLLFTRAEEIGFIGAIGACRDGTIPPGSRVIALENSRSFIDSPIGGGPIVRVGDRISVFTPALTADVARVAETIAGSPAEPTAAQKRADLGPWRWQRKLMAGGACEASVFCAYGYDATCVCLPLGNYHNMADLAAVQAGTNTTRPRVAREYIAVADLHGLVDLLIGCGRSLSQGTPARDPLHDRLGTLWSSRSFVVADPA